MFPKVVNLEIEILSEMNKERQASDMISSQYNIQAQVTTLHVIHNLCEQPSN
jgi:hypothetical protein